VDTIHQRDTRTYRQTDRHSDRQDTGRQQRPRLRIALRGKKGATTVLYIKLSK